jgi:hypothetical protein
MQKRNLSILRSLKQNVEELIAPLEAGEIEYFGGDSDKVQSGLDLMMGELTMIVLLLTDLDSGVSEHELELLNDMRHVVFGYGIPELNSTNYMELCRQFLSIHPDRHMTLDHLPLSIRLLQVYDKTHGTACAIKARMLFVQFAEAMINSDNDYHSLEIMRLKHFKDILNKEMNLGS